MEDNPLKLSEKAKQLDQFYTRQVIAKECYGIMQEVISELGIDSPFFIEPSAGTGSFYRLMPEERRVGLDLDPQYNGVIKQDYLKWDDMLSVPKPAVVLGNPPFGKLGQTGIKFINLSAYYADVIGFIMSNTFNRSFYARQLHRDLYLIKQHPLPRDSFYKPSGKRYSLDCNFFIWAKRLGNYTDIRNREVPNTDHPDFELLNLQPYEEHQMRVLDRFINYPYLHGKKFAFAVVRSWWKGYHPDKLVEYDLEKIKEKTKHTWILAFTDDQEVIDRLITLDFFGIGYDFVQCGFTVEDMVKAYNKIYPAKNKPKQLKLFY